MRNKNRMWSRDAISGSMRILLLADPNSSHTRKWVYGLLDSGCEVGLFGLGSGINEPYPEECYTYCFSITEESATAGNHSSTYPKLRYLKALPRLKTVIKKFSPQIIHAHYASSYGLMGALTCFHPYIISVWGSDVFDFPRQSFIHRLVFQYNLFRADRVLSTSWVMAKEISLYTKKHIDITPFGVDLEVFRPMQVERPFSEESIVIGTVKTMASHYGIEFLIRAFAIIKERHNTLPLKLLLVGGGPLESFLQNLTNQLGIIDDVVFTGKVSHTDVAKYHNMMDIEVFPSESESFGVAAVEASACERPIVASNVGGLPEVIEDGVTGIIVERANPMAIAVAIETLIFNKGLRSKMGKAGRVRVRKLFNWKENVEDMLEIYRKVLK